MPSVICMPWKIMSSDFTCCFYENILLSDLCVHFKTLLSATAVDWVNSLYLNIRSLGVTSDVTVEENPILIQGNIIVKSCSNIYKYQGFGIWMWSNLCKAISYRVIDTIPPDFCLLWGISPTLSLWRKTHLMAQTYRGTPTAQFH